MKRYLALFLLLALLTGCGSVSPEKAHESIQVIAMDTPMLLTAYGETATKAVYAAEDVIRELDAQLSRTNPESDVSRLNAAGGQEIQVGKALQILLGMGLDCATATDGAFDITMAPIISAWGFTEDSFRVPDPSELETLLESIHDPGMTLVTVGDRVQITEGYSVDLGGIAKGYAADRVAEVFEENGVECATAQLGGNVLAWGSRPDGDPWRIGLQDPNRPDNPEGFAGVLALSNAFAVTSGDYQRFFEQDGKRYHHIIDPATGYPADSGLRSVTVAASCEDAGGTFDLPGAMCDAFSTALFVMGEEKALAFRDEWNAVPSNTPFDLILITEDGRVVVTGDLDFTLDEESGYVLETVS